MLKDGTECKAKCCAPDYTKRYNCDSIIDTGIPEIIEIFPKVPKTLEQSLYDNRP